MNEIHIWLNNPPKNCITTYCETRLAIQKNKAVINTTQTHFCSFDAGRKIFVHFNDKIHEIQIGNCEGTDKELRFCHNVEKLLLAGAFDWFQF